MTSDQTNPKKKAARGFYILVGVLGANVVMMFGLIWLAEMNRPELVEPHYYTAGSIDSVKAQSLANRKSGWNPIVTYEKEIGHSLLRVVVFDSTKQSVRDLNVKVASYRPSSDLLDRPEQIMTEDSLGYRLEFQPPLQTGLWNILLSVASDKKINFRGRYPIIVE